MQACPDYSRREFVLHALERKGARFGLTGEHQVAFDSLQQAFSEVPLLQLPDFRKEFVLVTNAIDLAFTAVLNQRVGLELDTVYFIIVGC